MKAARAATLGTLVGLVAVPASPVPAYVPNTIDFVGGSAVVAHWPGSAFSDCDSGDARAHQRRAGGGGTGCS